MRLHHGLQCSYFYNINLNLHPKCITFYVERFSFSVILSSSSAMACDSFTKRSTSFPKPVTVRTGTVNRRRCLRFGISRKTQYKV